MANTVTFSSTETDICIDGLWQYDIGQTLDIMGLVPTGTPEMHWAYSALADLTPPQTIDIRTMTEVTTGEGEAAETYYTVDIPDLALSTADEVVGYIYDEGTGTGETIAVVRFYVEAREEPTDYAGVNDVVTLQDMIDDTIATTAHNSLASKQGGTTGQYYHLTSTQHIKADAIFPNMYLNNNNVFIGQDAGDDTVIGTGNTSLGNYALQNNETGIDNTGIGNAAGAFIADGITFNTTSDESVYIGVRTKALANNDQNEIVIGHNATGAGSNTATFGNEDIEDTILRGDVHVEKLVAVDGVSPAVGVTPAENDDSGQLATTAFVKNALDGVTGNEGAAIVQMTPNEYSALENKVVTTFYLVDGIDDVGVTGVALNKESTSIYVGSTEQLTSVVSPENATDKTVVWSSSNEAVATVDQTGLVTAVSAGSATITVTTTDGNYTANCTTTISSSYPGLWQGSKTKNGITVTIDGNHVTVSGTKKTKDYVSGGGYYTDNCTNLYEPPSVWTTFENGDSVSLTVANYSGSCNEPGANAVCALRNTDNTFLAIRTWGTPNGTSTYNFTGHTAVLGLLHYLSPGKVVDCSFDITFTVNGVNWIGDNYGE